MDCDHVFVSKNEESGDGMEKQVEMDLDLEKC
jgi:hypothetical protein